MRSLLDILRNRRPVSLAVITLFLCAACPSVPMSTVSAQGLAQVNLAGIPPVLPSPVVSDVAMDLEQGRFPMTFVFNSPDRQQSEFSFRVVLEHEGSVILDIMSEVASYSRGVYTYTSLDAEPRIDFPITYQEVVDALGVGLSQDLERTGLLSEGVYSLSVEAIPADPNDLVISVPGSAMFSVQYLDPPMILGPSEDEAVSDEIPVFTWLPVIGGPPGIVMDYEFLLVEVFPGQEPTQAINANRPVEQTVVTGVTSLPYTPDRLPLEAGKRYAWQVTARDAIGLVPFTDDGRSEISTFVFAARREALADWRYPFSEPAVLFNLADAELTGDGYVARGVFEGHSGNVPISALFDDVLLDPATLELLSGNIVLLGDLAESVGVVESYSARHLLIDDTKPTPPFLTTRMGSGPTGERLEVVLGPSEDPESGIRSVSYRLVPSDTAVTVDESLMLWNPVFESESRTARFSGGSYEVGLTPATAELLRQDRVMLQIQVSNGLGLEARFSSRVGAESDISPPVVLKPTLIYTGYYNPERPNAVELSAIRATDAESNIFSIEYRVVNPDGDTGAWTEIGTPGGRTYRTSPTVIQLGPADSDRTVRIDLRVTNAARLRTVWSENIDIDIDETEPVLVGPLARFATSESDPRIEILRDAVADYQSGMLEMSFRVVDDRQPTRVYVEWTPFPPGPLAEVKRTQLNFTTSRPVRVEVRAENRARLASTFSEVIQVPELRIGDRSPPSVPSVSLQVRRTGAGGEVVLELRIGSSGDPETGISRVQYRIEDAEAGSDLTGWVDVSGVGGQTFSGSAQSIPVRIAQDVESLRAVVRIVNGAGGATTASRQVSLASQDGTPPLIRSVQVYVQAGRVLAFIDGLEDAQSSISAVHYRIYSTSGTPLTDWIVYPVVPEGRPSYGRLLVRADIPAAASGMSDVIFRLRATNGAGLETIVEETVSLER